jgi:ribosome modulation factor
MKRTKRPAESRAFNRGYQCGVSGKAQESCPHIKIDMRANWLAGWRTGRDDRMAGYTGVAGLQRAQI